MKERLENQLEDVVEHFLKEIIGKEIQILSHFDTDGITSAAIMIKTLKKLDQRFSLKIIKNLDKKIIYSLDPSKITLFIDLASGSLKNIKEANLKKVFIIDHHQIDREIPSNVEIINPEIHKKQKISSSGLCYLFSKKINKKNKELAKLGILGMIGDTLEREIDKLNNGILEDGEIQRKRGLMIYPATRPLNRVLEFSSNPFIPEVTGNMKGVLELLNEIGLRKEKGKYPSLIELTEKEMEKLVTAVILRNPGKKQKELVGDLFLIKLFGKLEDARELSAKINACSRNGFPEVAIGLCLENSKSKKRAESIHVKYKQQLIAGIKKVESLEKLEGKKYVIINSKDQIKDTMIGTLCSILSNSSKYQKGTTIIGMGSDQNGQIKISGRTVGNEGRDIRKLFIKTMEFFEGEVGGHKFAAGCLIKREDEKKFIQNLKGQLEIETQVI